MKNLKIFKLHISSFSRGEIIEYMRHCLDSGAYHYQISVNVGKLVSAQDNDTLEKVINNADIVNADGMPIKWYIRCRYKIDVPRMGGLDYLDLCAEYFSDKRYYFLGATDEVVSKTASFYRDKYRLNIVGYRNGYFKKEEVSGIIKEINTLKPDFLFVAMGTPCKEYFLYDNRETLAVHFAVGVGGAFDIVVGKTRRAPVWMQNMGLEWFFRLMQEPRRMWNRYLFTNTRFILLIMKEMAAGLINRDQ